MKNSLRTPAQSRRRAAATRVGASIAVGCVIAAVGLTAAGPAQAAVPAPTLKWTKALSNRPVALSSPMVATLDGAGESVLIGDRSNHEYAVHINGGGYVAGWPVITNAAQVDSTASVLGSGPSAKVFWGEGTSSAPSHGAIRARAANGKTLWALTPKATPSGGTAGLMSSVSIGNLQSGNDIIGGAMGQEQYMVTSTGTTGLGFPWFQADSNFSTPAVSDPDKTGHDYIIEGGDSTKGNAYNVQYQNGGHIRVLKRTGNAGTGKPAGGLKCQYNTTQVVQSSPAVGHFFGGGQFGITVGTGDYYAKASDSAKEIAVDQSCKLRWKTSLNGSTASSPALADVLGNGTLSVIQGTKISATNGRVYAMSGVTGKIQWTAGIPGGVYGGVVTADLGTGYQDVIVPTPTGVYVLDGKTGKQVMKLGNGYGFQNNALVTDDPDGTVGLTVAGYNPKGGYMLHYSFPGSNGSKVNEAGAWPMFHHDQKLTGDADSPILN
jgi:hypothetical protein